MHIQQIRYFLALCDELNFTRSARRCGVSQPTLTGSIKRLEKEIGGQLFARRPSVSVTHLGEALIPHFRRIARDAEKALSLARSLNAGSNPSAKMRASGTCRLAKLKELAS
jgi:LysR family transcriptional regulator, hydrogen peroxide-inducible genes activator